MSIEQTFDSRYELKQAYSELLLPEIHSWVCMHPAGFRTAYPTRQVNSIYFDTSGLDTFNDHLAGVPVRRKLRYRWYGPNLGLAHAGQVEVKNKSERAGWKLTEKLSPDFNLAIHSWAVLSDAMRAASSELIRELLSVSRPTLLVVYTRDYLVSANGRVRLTIDSNLRGYNQLFAARPNLGFCNPPNGQVIVELKGDVKHAGELADVLSHFPIRANRFSKYVDNLWQDLV